MICVLFGVPVIYTRRSVRSQLGIGVSYRTLRTMARPVTMASLAMASGCSLSLYLPLFLTLSLYHPLHALPRSLSCSLALRRALVSPPSLLSLCFFACIHVTVSCFFHPLDLSFFPPPTFIFLNLPSLSLRRSFSLPFSVRVSTVPRLRFSLCPSISLSL